MRIFKEGITLDGLNRLCQNNLAEHLGIAFTTIGDNYLEATMPVDHRTRQPFGLLHGGASVALAETLGSVAGACCIDPQTQFCVGLEINANHIKSAKQGYVKGVVTPVHIGKKTHVWDIRIENEANDLICISRITLAVLDRQKTA